MGRGQSLRVRAVCRGEGTLYVVVGTKTGAVRLTARARLADGTAWPLSAFSLDTARLRRLLSKGDACAWVLVLPQCSLDVALTLSWAEGRERELALSPVASKVSSRALTVLAGEAAACLRGFERTHGAGRTQVRILEGWPAGPDVTSWRVRVSYPTDESASAPTLRACALDGTPLACVTHVLEDHVVPSSHERDALVRLVTFSCVLDACVLDFHVVAGLGDGFDLVGFDAMNGPRAASMVATARALEGGAATDAGYARWFESRRATEAELERQRQACEVLAHHPLVSIVMCVFRPDAAYLCEAIGSVLAQTYPYLELVVVNASGRHRATSRALAGLSDARMRVIEVENRSIAENTNVGIAAARGDYVGFVDHDDVLEPDALWCVMRSVAEHPEADLIYTDEDHLTGDEVRSPALKVPFNLGKLYCHNFVTHLLVVSRHALELTERSAAEVSGAQDFDLTLRVAEVAREVVHVERVLYHWREHAGSTAGGTDQKPYAHEAGRRALEGHLARRGLAATVADGPIGCTYHVRFALPDPAPKVSVVIPTCDQAALLERCVGSVLGSTYRNLELVLVENGSSRPETFELYERLAERDERVRVCPWPPSADGAPFNYSAVVNFGVGEATGEVVVLLNNDTEVIERSWVEEMLGCLMRPEVGLVGAKLLFADGLVQHAGMVANPDGNLCHVCRNLPSGALGAGLSVAAPGDVTMVTGACQMTWRELFVRLGGYDESLAVGYNDADFCLRVREAGHEVTLAPYATLYHREFATRGRESDDPRLRARHLEERSLAMGRHPAFFSGRDPWLNRNVDPYSAYFELDRKGSDA